jgi:hypothetical protein
MQLYKVGKRIIMLAKGFGGFAHLGRKLEVHEALYPAGGWRLLLPAGHRVGTLRTLLWPQGACIEDALDRPVSDTPLERQDFGGSKRAGGAPSRRPVPGIDLMQRSVATGALRSCYQWRFRRLFWLRVVASLAVTHPKASYQAACYRNKP